jgi:hypothetical protein
VFPTKTAVREGAFWKNLFTPLYIVALIVFLKKLTDSPAKKFA